MTEAGTYDDSYGVSWRDPEVTGSAETEQGRAADRRR